MGPRSSAAIPSGCKQGLLTLVVEVGTSDLRPWELSRPSEKTEAPRITAMPCIFCVLPLSFIPGSWR